MSKNIPTLKRLRHCPLAPRAAKTVMSQETYERTCKAMQMARLTGGRYRYKECQICKGDFPPEHLTINNDLEKQVLVEKGDMVMTKNISGKCESCGAQVTNLKTANDMRVCASCSFVVSRAKNYPETLVAALLKFHPPEKLTAYGLAVPVSGHEMSGEDIESLKSELKMMKVRAEGFNADLATAKNNLSERQLRIEKMIKKNQDLEEQIENLKQAAVAETENPYENSSDLHLEIKRLQAENNNLQKQISNLMLTVNAYQKNAKDLEKVAWDLARRTISGSVKGVYGTQLEIIRGGYNIDRSVKVTGKN